MSDRKSKIKFPLGQVLSTPGVLDSVPACETLQALRRHASGDWGEVCEQDAQENELSLRQGFRLFSVYISKDGIKFYIITEADRSVTTFLLPEEY